MKFLVDELTPFEDECPFAKQDWSSERWVYTCNLSGMDCNLSEGRATGECYGLKELERNR